MSVIFVVAPAVAASWPALCGAIAAASAALGYRALKASEHSVLDSAPENRVEVTVEGSDIVADAMKRDSEFVVSKDDVTAVFRRRADGQLTVHVSGESKTQQELTQIGHELVGRVTQQYAYNKVMTELREQGFTVASEEVSSDQAIRIRVTKFV